MTDPHHSVVPGIRPAAHIVACVLPIAVRITRPGLVLTWLNWVTHPLEDSFYSFQVHSPVFEYGAHAGTCGVLPERVSL